jgi:Tol biopolymer transport system component
MSDISTLLEREISSVRPAPDGLQKTLQIVHRRHRRRRVSAVLVAIAVSSGTLIALWFALRPTTQPVTPAAGLAGRIAFVRSTGGHQDIFVMNADGTGSVNLTKGQGENDSPHWSPDGDYLVFSSLRRGRWSVYMMDAGGKGVRLLVENGLVDGWSPYGNKILFTRERNGRYSDSNGDFDLWVADLTGRVIQLTHTPWAELSAAWSPDGSRIAVSISKDGRQEIYLMNADGTGLRKLTDNPAGADYLPAWSPDGLKIAFGGYRGGNKDIYVVPVVNTRHRAEGLPGTGVRRLTTGPGVDTHPTWSADGRMIAFASPRDGNYDIFVMNADGTEQRPLTRLPGVDGEPAWSPELEALPYRTELAVGFEPTT